MTRKFALGAIAVLSASFAPALAHAATLHPYVGALVGYDKVELEIQDETGSEGDIMYGGLVGIEVDVAPRVFLGVEAELNDSKVSSTEEDVVGLIEDTVLVGVTTKTSAGRELFVGARAGFRATDHVSIYALGGYSNFRAKTRVQIDGSPTVTEDSATLHGSRLGAGVEFGFGHLRLRGEYRHANYEEFDFLDEEDGVDTSRDQFVAAAVLGF